MEELFPSFLHSLLYLYSFYSIILWIIPVRKISQMIRVYLLAVSPDSFKIIEKAVFLIEYMNDHIAEI